MKRDLAKVSYYNVIVEEPARIAYNFFSGALVEFTTRSYLLLFKKVLNTPNITDTNLVSLRNEMIEMGFLIPSDIDELETIKLRHQQAQSDNTVLELTIVPEMGCNFSCYYCYQRDKHGRMSAKVQTAISSFVKEKLFSGVRALHVVWYGGEPLLGLDLIEKLSQDFIRYVEIVNASYVASMVTNGYLLTEKVCQKLAALKMSFVQITLDGTKLIHDKRRVLKNGDGTFNTIIDNLQSAVKYFNVGLRVNIDRENESSIENLLRYLDNLGLGKKIHPYIGNVEPYPWAETRGCLDSESFTKIATSTYSKAAESGHPANLGVELDPRDVRCVGDRVNNLVINCEGYILKCWNDLSSAEDVEKKNIGNILEGISQDKVAQAKYRHSPFNDEEYLECKILPICLGGCPEAFASSGRKLCSIVKGNEKRYVHLKWLSSTKSSEGGEEE